MDLTFKLDFRGSTAITKKEKKEEREKWKVGWREGTQYKEMLLPHYREFRQEMFKETVNVRDNGVHVELWN